MKRLISTALAFVVLSAIPAFAQFGNDRRDSKTGRTEDGLKADQEIDRLYRARTGQKTPEVRPDPWSDVRTPSAAAPAATPAAKSKKQP